MKLFHFISKLLWKQLWQYNRRQCFVADILLCVKLCFSLALNTIAQRKELFQFCSSSKNFKMQFQSNTHEAWNNCMKYHREEQYFNSDFQKGEGQCGASGVWWNGDSGKNGDHLSWKGPSFCIKCGPVNSAECCVVLSQLDKYWVSQLTPAYVASVKVPPHPHPPIFPLLSTVGLWCPRWLVAEYYFEMSK